MRCANCYLTPGQLSSPERIDPAVAADMIKQVQSHYCVTHVDIYGGEISALPSEYQLDLYRSIADTYHGPINIVTNYLKRSPLIGLPNTTLSVSFDFEFREHHQYIYERLLLESEPVHLLVLATPDVIRGSVDRMIEMVNAIPAISSVEIKPYSSNQSNQKQVSHVQYEAFIRSWIISTVEKRFDFTNEHALRQVLYGGRNNMSNDHIYITPQGEYAVLDFDLNDHEYFRRVGSLDEYIEWCSREINQTHLDSYCNNCQYLGQCLTEHMRRVVSVDESCNGYHNLITWYKHERMAS